MVKLDEICMIWDNQTLWPKARQSLQSQSPKDQCHLVAAIYQNELFKFSDDPHLYICSAQISIFKIILGYLNCSIGFEISYENFGGIKMNNKWNGILALLDAKKADFVPHTFALIAGREELLYQNFIVPRRALLSIISYPKEVISTSAAKLFNCFDLQIWILTLASFVVAGLTISAISCVQYHQCCWSNNHYRYFSYFFDLFAVLDGQGDVSLLRRFKSSQIRTVLLVWMLFGLLFRQFYSTEITAMMLSRTPVIIDSFDQLNKDFSIMAEVKSISLRQFVKLYPELESKVIPLKNEEVASMDTVVKLIQTNSVLIHLGDRLEQIRTAYSHLKLHISAEGFLKLAYSFGIRNTLNQDLKKKLDRLFHTLYVTGILETTNQKVLHNRLTSLHKTNPTLNLKEILALINSGKSSLVSTKLMNHEIGYRYDRQVSMVDLVDIQNDIDIENAKLDIGIIVRFYLTGITFSVVCLFAEIVIFLRIAIENWTKSMLNSIAIKIHNKLKKFK